MPGMLCCVLVQDTVSHSASILRCTNEKLTISAGNMGQLARMQIMSLEEFTVNCFFLSVLILSIFVGLNLRISLYIIIVFNSGVCPP